MGLEVEKPERRKVKQGIKMRILGDYALFSDPITRVGGEKSSYPVPTYQAIIGMIENVYWKPSIIYEIDSLRVMNRIQTCSKNVRPINYHDDGNELSIYQYLTNVEYEITAHFIFNQNRPDLKNDWDENKHYAIACESIKKGGRRDCFLGVRECVGYVLPSEENTKGYYDNSGEIDLGVMFHSFDYPNASNDYTLSVRLWRAKMIDGVIKFPKPEDCSIIKKIRQVKDKAVMK